ncbi:hypothetical protein DVT68_00240 [Dyella solisilvae]|uniref:Uncharacterized protein n=1 Tax=Dyella solisilvae TaxID=1920168 RepID=A0A370K9L5_9GAMM|nr:tetratricopeptide repeat protein [Dyella solisilvae]RDI99331.1 hypothetical protein DVT68_00240 [Dyella solisilvae]
MSHVAKLRTFYRRDPHNLPLCCDFIDSLLAEGQLAEAAGVLDALPEPLRQSAPVQWRAARYALMTGDFEHCIATLLPLVGQLPEAEVAIRHDVAFAWAAQGEIEEALRTLEPVVQSGGAAVALLYARVLHQQGRYEEALRALEGADEPSRLAEVRGLRSLLLLDMNDTAQSRAEADLALAADSSQHEALLTLGTLTLWEKNAEFSCQLFRRILADHPHSGRALLGLGESLMLLGDVPAARAQLDRAGKDMPRHIGTWHALAWCQLLEGDLAGAHYSFDRAFELDRTFGETHGGFALVHALRGERPEAQEAIKRARRLAPHGFSARYAESVLLLDDGHVEQASEAVRGILRDAREGGVALPEDFIFRVRDLVRPRG